MQHDAMALLKRRTLHLDLKPRKACRNYSLDPATNFLVDSASANRSSSYHPCHRDRHGPADERPEKVREAVHWQTFPKSAGGPGG
jgi:hypothetical protein